MRILAQTALAALLVTCFAPVGLAQAQPAPAGHWEGAIQAPDRTVDIHVDLAKNEKGEWIGSLSTPSMNLTDLPLTNITVKGSSVSFEIAGVPGKPVLEGKVAEDGKSISGNLLQSGATIPFQLKWTGEGKVKEPPKSGPLSKELEGAWEGTLEAGGQSFRLAMRFSKAADGTAAGAMDSLDQNARDMTLAGITQEGLAVQFKLPLVGGAYAGKLNKEGTELAGEWTQSGNTLPLTWKRPPKAPAETKK
jgi:hypothetical protein